MIDPSYYPCPQCEYELEELVSFQNLCDQYDKDKILVCPSCNVKLKLEYDEYVDDDGYDNSYWSFRQLSDL